MARPQQIIPNSQEVIAEKTGRITRPWFLYLSSLAGVKRERAIVTNANLLTVPATPVVLIAAPGSGFVLRLLMATLTVNATAGAYAVGADDYLFIGYNGLESAIASAYVANDSGLGLTDLDTLMEVADVNDVQLAPYSQAQTTFGVLGLPGLLSARENQPLSLGASGTFTGGNAANTLRVTLYYTVEAT
jgi:hypothetical protein